MVCHTTGIKILYHICSGVYRAPSGNSEYSVDGLDDILNFLYKPRTEFVICDYMHTDLLKVTTNVSILHLYYLILYQL
jgi:hypothetical protein